MRKSALLATVAVAAVPVVGIAQAATVDQQANMGFFGFTDATETALKSGTIKAGTAKKPNAVALSVQTVTTKKVDSESFATKTATIDFDKYLVFDALNVKGCAAADIQANEASCPSGSKIGKGVAVGTALGQVENITVTAFNGVLTAAEKKKLTTARKKKKAPAKGTILGRVNLHVVGTAPLAIDSVIEATLKKTDGKFGSRLDVPIPDNLQQPVPGVYATLALFTTTINKKVVGGKPYVGLTGCPSSKKLSIKGKFVFTDGTSKTDNSAVACKK